MKSVLLIDDDIVCNFLSIKTLERMGLANDIHAALNGQLALDLFKDHYQGSRKLPDIILLDISMPIMDGFTFLEEFQDLHLPNQERVKIIIVSSSLNPRDLQRAKELGITHYINKPIKEDNLRGVRMRMKLFASLSLHGIILLAFIKHSRIHFYRRLSNDL